MKKSELIQIIKEEVKNVLKEDIFQTELKAIHFETDPKKQEQLKKAYGRKTGALSSSSQIEAADYALKRFRREIGYDNGKSGSEGLTDVFIPGSSMAAFSKLGDGPHAKSVVRKTWNQREYDKWIKSMAGNGGAKHGYDMAQNAKNEPGLIDWVKKNVVYDETPLERIQWDIEAYS